MLTQVPKYLLVPLMFIADISSFKRAYLCFNSHSVVYILIYHNLQLQHIRMQCCQSNTGEA